MAALVTTSFGSVLRALTLNITGGVRMIAAGVIGAVILGFAQDKTIDTNLSGYDSTHNTALLAPASAEEQNTVQLIQEVAKKEALQTDAIFPMMIILAGFLFLPFYFKFRVGYKVVLLPEKETQEEASAARQPTIQTTKGA